MITTLEETYKYRKEVLENIIPELEKLFGELDNYASEKGACKFPRPFSANIYWFVITILDLIMKENGNEKDHCYYGISANDIYFNSLRGSGQIKSAELNIIPKTLKDKIKKIMDLKEKLKFRGKSFLVIQDGYEVSELKKYMCDYAFIKLKRLKFDKFFPFKRLDLNLDMYNLIDSLGRKITGYREEWLYQFLNGYFRNIVQRLDWYYLNYESQIIDLKPRALLYSIGSNTVFEEMIAYIADRHNISIICFQHCGDRRYASNPLVKYFEAEQFGNVKIKRIDIEEYGSMKLYNFYQNKITKKKKKRDVLYICSSPLETAKEHLLNIPLNMQLNNHAEILNSCIRRGYKIDVKPHPIKEKEQYRYFKLLTTGLEKKVKILKGIKAENIIDDYKIIILDFLQSNVTDSVFLSNAEVILYLKDKKIIMNHELLKKINVHLNIVNNQSELEEKLISPIIWIRDRKRIIEGRYRSMGRGIINPAFKIVEKIKRGACNE